MEQEFAVVVWPMWAKNILHTRIVVIRACCEFHATNRALDNDHSLVAARAFDAPDPN